MESSDEMRQEENLKHLGFVRIAAIQTLVWISSLYQNAKPNAAPVALVENAVATLFSPLYNKFMPLSHHLLVFLDHQVDKGMAKLDEKAPALVKQVARKVKEVVHRAEAGGPLEAAQYALNETKKLLVDQSVKMWWKLDQLHPFHVVAEMTIPTAAHLSKGYNKVVGGEYSSLLSYLPRVPLEEIAKAFKQPSCGSQSESESESQGENVNVM